MSLQSRALHDPEQDRSEQEMNLLNSIKVFVCLPAIVLSTSCAPSTGTNGGVYLRNLSKAPVTAFLKTELGDSRGDQVEAGEKRVIGVFLRTDEKGTVEVTDETGKTHSIPVKAEGRSGKDVTVEFP